MQDEFYPDMPQPPQAMPGPSSDAMYADIVRERKVENLLSQINPDNLLADIEARIRGYRKDQYSNQWVRIPGARQVSEKLVGNFMSFLGGILNNNTTLSNFQEREINNIMRIVVYYISDDLRTNAKEYGIDGDYTEWSRIGLILCNAVFATLKRAQNGSEAIKIFKAIKIGESGNPYTPEKQQGLWESMKFWK